MYQLATVSAKREDAPGATLRAGECIRKGPIEMPFIVWTNELSVDVKMLDNDHKKLAILINDLHEGLMAGRDSKDLERVFDELVACSRLHFAHEEHLLAEAGYSGAAAHKQEHDQKVHQILTLQARFLGAKESADYLEVLDLLKYWLFTHMERSDKEFVAHLKATGVDSILATWDEPK
jgi:hemerythrin-like metal-binding protein